MTSTTIDETWLRHDDAEDLRAAAAVLIRRAKPGWVLRLVVRELRAVAAMLDS